jgi:hypothetical protein
MLTALLFTWGNTVINYYQYQFSQAYRPSQLRFPDKRLKVHDALAGTLLTWWIYRITYIIGLCFAKLSILFFFRAIATRSTFRRVVWATIIFVSLSTIAVTIGNIFQCERPADAFSVAQFASQFNNPGQPKIRRGKCFQPTLLWVFSAAINLFTDVIILLLPIPTLLSLRVPISKRLALVGIFSVGIMAIVASCVRMWIMALWAESISNSGRFGAELLLWGQIEVNAGIASASVPFLRLLFTRDKAPVKDVEGPPVQMRNVNNKPLELNSLQIFGGPDKGPNGSPIWKPFITVPASLSSRDSATMVDTSGHHSNHSHTTTI